MATLTHRQIAVMVGLSQGLPTGEIARRMNRSRRTILRDIAATQTELAIPGPEFSAVALVNRARETGLIQSGARLNQNGHIVYSAAAVARSGGPRIQ